jgi:hypothetical protein
MSTRARFGSRDAVLAVLVFVGIVAYLVYLPRTLGRADESHFLYEAKRIRDGEIMYRDFFQFVTPGAPYVMALLFWAFGTSIQTARVATAVLHGLTGVVLYATGRRLGVRRAVSIIPPVAYIALCQPGWQFASWHWFSTFFTTLVLFLMLRVPWESRPRSAIIPGLAAGLLTGVQQQKGFAVGLGVAAVFVIDHLAGRRDPTHGSWRELAARLTSFGAGIAIVVVPLLTTFVWLVGFEPVFDALVRFPLVNYRHSFRTTWGNVLWITQGYASYTYPVILKYLPVALVPAVLRVIVGLFAGMDRAELRQLIVLIVSSGAAALSIWYFPDFIHVGFIGPVFLVAGAEALEWGLRTVEPVLGRAWRGVRHQGRDYAGTAVAGALLGVLSLHLYRNAVLLKEQFRYPHDTAFGRIDFSVRWEPIMVDRARALLSQSASNELFAYPNTSEPYLTTGGRNPTPYQYFFSPVSPREHTEKVLSILQTGSVPYVVCQELFIHPRDPVARVILDNYEPVDIPALNDLAELPTLTLYQRKDGVPAPPDEATN